ncbi:S-layer homology domain-containing protein [Bacillus dakarensis]|uniref:S-layer homology domain-containing protein n=1 Tax=Robertmurraya dakarensis TaxID=1926278 RepID=UPI000980A4E2|nr:S-layer homology domain-containing protein [Bacillus dakarensis]
MPSISNWWMKKALPGVLAATLTLSYGAAVSADGVQSENKQESSVVVFTDIENHWAQEAIERMAEHGVINGYPDSTFRPNDPVTQLQAVTIVMNVLKQRSNDLLTDGDAYMGWIPEYAKETVELALYNEIISWADIQPFGESATRMFVANLLANALDTNNNTAIDLGSLTFTDISDLSAIEKINLAVAVDNKLVTGHEDNTFRPNNSVTRAQMATFANRLFDKLEAKEEDPVNEPERFEVVAGEITNIAADRNELTIGSATLKVSEEAKVKINEKTAKLADLEAKMEVRVLIQNEQIVEINAYKSTDDETIEEGVAFDRIVTGKISEVSVVDRELKIDSKTFKVSNNVLIEINGKLADFKYLEKNMQVVIVVVKDQIESIYAFNVEEQEPLEFNVVKNSDKGADFKEAKLTGDRVNDETPDLKDGKLTIRINNGTRTTVDVEEINGDQQDGEEVAEELEEAIEDALNAKRVKVTFDANRDRFIFESINSPKNEVPAIQFSGDKAVLDALGLDTDTIKGSSSELSWKISVKSTAAFDETYELHMKIKNENVNVTVRFSVEKGDTAEEVAEEIAEALEDNSYIKSIFDIDADDEEVILTPDDDDYEVEIEITVS